VAPLCRAARVFGGSTYDQQALTVPWDRGPKGWGMLKLAKALRVAAVLLNVVCQAKVLAA